MSKPLPTDNMSATDFEEFCFDLLRELGFVNTDWRKGTGLVASPSDSGRDIVASSSARKSTAGSTTRPGSLTANTTSVAWPKEVSSLLAWATAERADVALVVASGHLSNPCKDFLKQYETTNRPPFRIRYWERPTLGRLTEGGDEFINRYRLQPNVRTEAEILEAEQEFFDRVWYDRSLVGEVEGRRAKKRLPEDIFKVMIAARRDVEARYGKQNLGPYTKFEWGMINGKLSALRWVLGDEWDFLDT